MSITQTLQKKNKHLLLQLGSFKMYTIIQNVRKMMYEIKNKSLKHLFIHLLTISPL